MPPNFRSIIHEGGKAMRQFKSLNPEILPKGFDAEVQGEEPIVDVTEATGRITISYSFPGFYLVDDTKSVASESVEFKQVNIAGVGHLAESGKPLLPSFGRYVQIPCGAKLRLKVEKSAPVRFDDVLVLPAQEGILDDPKHRHEFEYDRDHYSQGDMYPRDIVKISAPIEIDEYCAVMVHVCPFQYNPAKRQLTGYGNITVSLDIVQKKTKTGSVDSTRSLQDREAFGNLFLNPGRSIEERLGLEPATRFFRPSGPDFLILYATPLKKAADKLSAWKTRRGIVCKAVSIDQVGNDPVKIKAYIRGIRGAIGSRLRYVVLLGDSDMISPEKNLLCPYGENASDYYYATKEDPGPAGELRYPWLSIGRIPVRKETEALGVVDQIIAYEKNPPGESGYYQRMAFAAFFQEDDAPGNPGYGKDNRGYLKTIEDIRSHMTSLGYSGERVYVSNNPSPQFYNDGTPIPAEVKAAFVDSATATSMLVEATTEGQLIMAHRDHGSFSGWSHPPFDLSDLDNITGTMPTLFYSINCLTGQFDAGVAESFAEKNLRMAGTAPSLIAATRVSQTWLNNYLIKALFDALFGGLLPTYPAGTASYPIKANRLGDILNYAKAYLPTQSTDTAIIKDHFEIYHVVGDPTLEIWNAMPGLLKLRAALRRGVLDIQMSGCPKGSVLTLWYGAQLIKRIEPSSTHITIPIKGLVKPGILPKIRRPSLYICLWAPGFRYSEVKLLLPFTPTGPFVKEKPRIAPRREVVREKEDMTT
jgi:hypothetical protein